MIVTWIQLQLVVLKRSDTHWLRKCNLCVLNKKYVEKNVQEIY